MGFKQEYNSLINEQSNKKPVVGYIGRFNPPTINHYKTYQYLVKKYGKDNVYILTSNKTDKKRSPFDFEGRKKIWMGMFGIPKDKIVQTKMPYIPKELFDTKKISGDTPFIAAVGEKDSTRLKNFVDYEGQVTSNKDLTGWSEDVHERAKIHAYYDVTPMMTTKFDGDIISGTTVRNIFKSSDEDKKIELFKSLYNKYDKSIFNFIKDKINGI